MSGDKIFMTGSREVSFVCFNSAHPKHLKNNLCSHKCRSKLCCDLDFTIIGVASVIIIVQNLIGLLMRQSSLFVTILSAKCTTEMDCSTGKPEA